MRAVVDDIIGDAEELASTTRAKGRKAKLQASEEVHNFFSDVEDLLRKVAHVSDADVAQLRSKVAGTMSAARQAVEGSADSVRKRTSDAADATDKYVRSRPWTAIGIAVAVGVMLGIGASRR